MGLDCWALDFARNLQAVASVGPSLFCFAVAAGTFLETVWIVSVGVASRHFEHNARRV